MKVYFAFLLAVVIALPVTAHPGKTDRDGGHKCYKECAEWDLYYNEYHLHDKHGRPIKVVKKIASQRYRAEQNAVIEQRPVEVPLVPVVPPVAQAATVPDESGLPLLWILLALFLLLFLVIRRKGKEKIDGNA